VLADVAAGTSRVDWERKYAYPQPRVYTFSEIVTPSAGYVEGIDSTGRNKQSLDSNPPAHSMSGLRLAATQRESARTSPVFLGTLASARERVSAVPDVTLAGVAYPAVEYKLGEQSLTVMFDARTGLPARVRAPDYDNIWGDVSYDLVLSDWRAANGLQIPGTLEYELSGKTISEIKVSDIQVNVPVPADRVSIPAAVLASAAKPATRQIPYQWVLRRQIIGTYLDSDEPSFDTRVATPGLKLSELGTGIQQVVGGSHNSLLIEMKDHVIAFDAPISDAQSNWTLAAAKEKFPNKPVKYLVLMHHHMDHSGGLRAYAAQGATVVVAKGSAEHFKKALAAPFTRNPHLTSKDLSATPIVEVDGRQVLTDGTREVTLQVIENPHATGMLVGYIADANLGWVTDLWSPGRDPLPEKLNANQAAFVAAVKKAGLNPAKFAAAHGSTGEFAPLAALEGK
jgi:glyoxylase-like metal-dependent hydrolase (beta-lactamase superfamily II)